MSCESDVCRQDIPYPIVSQESVASILGNLTSALYGTVTKTVVDGRVVWTTCDLNQQATVFGIPRNSGEGLMCYFLRAFQDTRAIITPTAPAVNQLLRSVQAGSQSLSWIGYSSTASQNTIVLRDNTGSTQLYDLAVAGTLTVGIGITFPDGSTQTTEAITSLSGDLSGSPASSGIASATVVGIRGIGVSPTSPTSGQVLKYNGTQWAPSTDVGITALTGDVVASGTGSVVATLANSGVVAGVYGSTSQVASLSVDSKGRITSVTNAAITPASIGAMPVFSNLGIALGGTGSTTAAGARTALGVDASGTTVLKTGDTMSGALTVSTTGTGTSLTVSNAATATSDCVVITNQGTGRSLIVNDVSGDATPFVIDASGRVGIGVATSTFALDVYNKNQTTDGVVRFSYDISGSRTTALDIASNGEVVTYGTLNSSGLLAVSTQGIFFNQNSSTQTKAGITSLTGDVTASAGDATASVVRIQGRSVASTAPTSGQVLAWNGTAWTPTTTGGGTVTSITAGSGLSGGAITSSGTISANFGTSAGTITEGGTTVLKAGDQMTGKLGIGTAPTTAALTIDTSGISFSGYTQVQTRPFSATTISSSIGALSIANGGYQSLTVNASAGSLALNRPVIVSITNSLSGLNPAGLVISAYVRTTSQIAVTIFNPTSSTITLDSTSAVSCTVINLA